jgi:hypothetical protein
MENPGVHSEVEKKDSYTCNKKYQINTFERDHCGRSAALAERAGTTPMMFAWQKK